MTRAIEGNRGEYPPGAASAPLEYAPAPPVRRWMRRVALGFVVLVVAGIVAWSGSLLWRRGWTAHVTRQACTYATPGAVVYQDGPLTTRPLFRSMPRPQTAATSVAHAAGDPPLLGRLAGVAADPRIFGMFAPRGSTPEPLVFLHERRTPRGQRMLVAVRLSGLTYYPNNNGTLACTYRALLIHPNGSHPPTLISLTSAWGGVHLPTADELNSAVAPPAPDPAAPTTPRTVRVFFGVPDPADPSAFTVPYEVNGQTKRWQFRLTEKGLHLDDQDATGGG